jgi:hypothetical protein
MESGKNYTSAQKGNRQMWITTAQFQTFAHSPKSLRN